MIKWHVVFEDDPQNETVRRVGEDELRADTLARFDSLAVAGEIGGREIRGMWMVDHATEQADVVRTHGLTPVDTKPVLGRAKQMGEGRPRQSGPRFGRR